MLGCVAVCGELNTLIETLPPLGRQTLRLASLPRLALLPPLAPPSPGGKVFQMIITHVMQLEREENKSHYPSCTVAPDLREQRKNLHQKLALLPW